MKFKYGIEAILGAVFCYCNDKRAFFYMIPMKNCIVYTFICYANGNNMTTVKIKFRASLVEEKEGALYYQVIHKRSVRRINTGYRILSEEWDGTSSRICLPERGSIRYDRLVVIERKVLEDFGRIKNIIAELERRQEDFTADQVVELFRSEDEERGFLAFARTLIKQLRNIGKERTADSYTSAVNSFDRFIGDEVDVSLDLIQSDLMVGYETYLKMCGVCPNSSSFYMRNLRAIYNRAVEKGLTNPRNPFKHVYTGIGKTVKRSVSLKVIRQIRDMDLGHTPELDYARDLFMFSFYTRGMSFVDMAYLKKSDLRNGILVYRRHKTNQQLFVRWEQPMQDIVDKYDTAESPYLLPIIRNNEKDPRSQYKNALHLLNRKLKVIGQRLELPVALTTYVARHTWASVAQSKNVSISVISEAMGHDSESTTRIYLASLDKSQVDKANKLILGLL